jgi:uncharacterized Fe-S center protein
MSKVIFVETEESLLPALEKELAKIFGKEEKIAIKLHMGEPGNKTALKPAFVKKIVDILKKLGAEPFLFDSPVTYNSPRNTEEGYLLAAGQMGFSGSALGCKVIISDESIPLKGKELTYGVCKTLADADGVLVLTHVKGHVCTGFGGAIKNLGMGAVSKQTKCFIHDGGAPKYIGGCTMCRACQRSCPTDNIRYEKDMPFFDKTWCSGCSNCSYVCPVSAIKPALTGFDFLLSEAASLALKSFKKAYFLNVMKDITKNCDCNSDPGPIIHPDVGYVLGKDILSVEKASFDLINKAAGEDFFRRVNKKTPLLHIKEAEKLGMGSLEYKLETIK